MRWPTLLLVITACEVPDLQEAQPAPCPTLYCERDLSENWQCAELAPGGAEVCPDLRAALHEARRGERGTVR